MNKNIIIAILVVIIIGCIGAFMFAQHPFGKQGTQIQFTSDNTLQNGEQVQFELKDSQGNVLSGQTVSITFNNEKFTLTTDQNGKGYVTISGEDAGSYDLEAEYGGDDKYDGSSAKVTITVTDGDADDSSSETDSAATVSTSSSGNSSSSDGSQYPVSVDSGGITREEAKEYGYRYTSEHGGHYIGENDHWDEDAHEYHD